MTTTKTFKAIIKGETFTVEQLYFGGQDIRYKLNNTVITADSFWKLKPKIKN